MTLLKMVTEIGMGTDIRGGDPTKAAIRAIRDALWHNSLTIAAALDLPSEAMQIEILIGVPYPERVDKQKILEEIPHGSGTIEVISGGLEIPNETNTDVTLIANAAAIVRLELN